MTKKERLRLNTVHVFEMVKANFEVYTLTSKGAGHSITEDGLRAALQFIKNIL